MSGGGGCCYEESSEAVRSSACMAKWEVGADDVISLRQAEHYPQPEDNIVFSTQLPTKQRKEDVTFLVLHTCKNLFF